MASNVSNVQDSAPAPAQPRRSSLRGLSPSSNPERRSSRRERLSGRGFFPTTSDDEYDEEADAEARVGLLTTLATRMAWFFGANATINLPLRLVFLRQASRPLGRPNNSLVAGVAGILPPLAARRPPSVGEPSASWRSVLGSTALIGASEMSAGLFAGAIAMFLDLGHIPSVTEWQEHEKLSIFGLVSRKQLAAFTSKFLTGACFYPFFAVMPILVANHRWSGLGDFFSNMLHNRNSFWNAVLLNMIKYSVIDLAPWLELKLYNYLKLEPEEYDPAQENWEHEVEPFFSTRQFEKYGLSLTSTVLACLLYVPLDVLTTQLVLYPSQYSGIADCFRKIWRVEGLSGLYRGFWANLLSEQELLFI